MDRTYSQAIIGHPGGFHVWVGQQASPNPLAIGRVRGRYAEDLAMWGPCHIFRGTFEDALEQALRFDWETDWAERDPWRGCIPMFRIDRERIEISKEAA